jgi:streptogramin lyase
VEECYDKNDNDVIDTSTGPTDVKAWEEDECMMWHTPLGGQSSGARATAWDGEEDPETGLGGHVWIGTCNFVGYEQKVYKLDGEWGDIDEEIWAPISCAYGGAMDGTGGFWIYDSGGYQIARVDTATLEVETHQVNCGYGISVDSQGRVWTGGWGNMVNSCVSRFDPATNTEEYVNVSGAQFLRGIAVGIADTMSAGSVWAADTSGRLYEIDEETVTVLDDWTVGGDNMIGVAIDFEGYVWTVSQGANSAYKFNPETAEQTSVIIGSMPYTYSDMTGAQLHNVLPVE